MKSVEPALLRRLNDHTSERNSDVQVLKIIWEHVEKGVALLIAGGVVAWVKRCWNKFQEAREIRKAIDQIELIGPQKQADDNFGRHRR